MASSRATGRTTPTTPARNANWQARFEVVVDTSAKAFAVAGYHGTGIADLCEANGLGKGALYHYIGSKEELLAAIHNRVMDEVAASAARVDAAGGGPVERLTMLGHELIEIITRYPDHVSVFLHDFRALTGARAKEFRKRRRAYEATVEAILAEGIASGDFRDLDAAFTARAWLGMHNYTYLWLRSDGLLSAPEVASRFAEIFIGGIAR